MLIVIHFDHEVWLNLLDSHRDNITVLIRGILVCKIISISCNYFSTLLHLNERKEVPNY